MARGHEPLTARSAYYPNHGWWLPGTAAGLLLLAMVVTPVIALGLSFDASQGTAVLNQAYTWRVVRFSLWQATLSTAISLTLAVPMAVALGRRGPFRGRALLLRIFSVPLVMPTLVAITGLVVAYGSRGWLSEALQGIGWEGEYRFYGLGGVLLAHVFFNFPLATRVLLQAIEGVPVENWRLAAQFGLRGRTVFALLEWPACMRALPALAALVFSLCFTSFAVVLTLGGGPAATTIEVAIYQALRLDFDIPTAVVLALLQIVLCAIVLGVSSVLGRPASFGGMDAVRCARPAPAKRLGLNLLIVSGLAFVTAPLLAVVVRGLNADLAVVLARASVWQALGQTALVGLAAGASATCLALGLLASSRHLRLRLGAERRGRALATFGLVILVVPNVVISAGLFLLLRDVIDVFANAVWLVIAVNALVGLPFACALIGDTLIASAERYDRLCAALGVFSLSRWRLIEWPMLRKPLGTALGMCSALAAGDLTAIALFGSLDFETLPLVLYRLVGSYRLGEASVVAMLLLLLCLALFWFCDRVLGGRAHAAA